MLASLRVAVLGAGVAGPTVAMLLKQRLGCIPTVFEASHAIKEVGAGISLAPNGLRVLNALGHHPSLAHKVAYEVGEPIPISHVMRPDSSTITRFDSEGTQKFGFPMVGVRRFRLLNVLLEHMQQMDIPLQLGKRLAAIQGLPPLPRDTSGRSTLAGGTAPAHEPSSGPVCLEFEDGSTFEADLVIGCDGLRSKARAILQDGKEAPQGMYLPRYTQNEVVFAVTCDRNKDLVPQGHVQMVFGPPGLRASGGQHYGAYGLGTDCAWFASLARNTEANPGPGSSSSQAPDNWGTVTDAAVMESIKQELRERFDGWRAVQRMLDRDVAAMIRVGIYDRDATKTWVRGPVVLAGDAAAPIPPNLGQGGNKALENAGLLVECLTRHEGDIPAALQQYERLSSKRAADLLAYSRQAAAMFDLTNPLAIAARNAMFRAVVAVNGTLPSDWLWQYDCQAVVDGDKGLCHPRMTPTRRCVPHHVGSLHGKKPRL